MPVDETSSKAASEAEENYAELMVSPERKLSEAIGAENTNVSPAVKETK